MRSYPQMTKEHILFRLPCTDGWALYAYAVKSDPFANNLDFDANAPGYVAQERLKLCQAAAS